MTNLTIFYVVFIAQIFLLSVFYPRKLLTRMRLIQQRFPKSSHPKLYPKSTNHYQKTAKAYGLLNSLIFILGWFIVYFIFEGSLLGEKGVNPMLPWTYFMIQMIPTMMLEIFGFRMSKLMKKEDTRTQKFADLAPRKLFQYISPTLFFTAIIAYFGFVFFALYIEGFTFDIGGKAVLMSLILLTGYLFFFAMIVWLIYGKKRDPYQSQEDRIKTVSLVVKTFCYLMIVCSFFMAFSITASTFDLKALMPVAMSLFLQFIVVVSTGYVLQKNRLEDINFDVYKQG